MRSKLFPFAPICRFRGVLCSIAIIVLLYIVSVRNHCAAQTTSDGEDFLKKCIGELKVNDHENIQIVLQKMYRALTQRYEGMSVAAFERHVREMPWKKLDNKIHIEYQIKKSFYVPSKGNIHALKFRFYFAAGRIIHAMPVLSISNIGGYSKLENIGYSKKSALGRFIKLPHFKNLAKTSINIELLEMSYAEIRGISPSSPQAKFICAFYIYVALVQRNDNFASARYLVGSKLDYADEFAQSEDDYVPENSLCKPGWWHDDSGDTLLPEDDGESIFELEYGG